MGVKLLKEISNLKPLMNQEKYKETLEAFFDVNSVVNDSLGGEFFCFALSNLCLNLNLSIVTAIEAKTNAQTSNKYCFEVTLNGVTYAIAINNNNIFVNSLISTQEVQQAILIAMAYKTLLQNNAENIIFDLENNTVDAFTIATLSDLFYQDVENMVDVASRSKKSVPWGLLSFDAGTPDYAQNIVGYNRLNSGVLDTVDNNSFQVFTIGKSSKIDRNKLKFDSQDWVIDPNRIYNDFETERLANNKLVDGYIPTQDDKDLVTRVYNSIKKRNFSPAIFLYGEAGTGKSEKGKFISAKTGLPYTFVCCSATTNEADLRGKPQSLGANGGLVSFFKKTIKTLWNKDIPIPKELESDKIEYSLTELVLACKYGWIIEIQEPTLIVNAGTLGFLNCVLDNNRTLILPSGEQIKIHPNTTFIFTTNLTYEGCNLLNNSLLSRMGYVIKINRPTVKEQVERVISVTGFTGPKNEVERVIQAVNEINTMIDENQITQGVSDLRCAIECVNDYMLNDDDSWRKSARLTIEHKSILEPGFEQTVKDKLDAIFGEE